ncbi:MAG: hypothetical protein LBK54_11785 [Propionibacteriaceae bacterium]|jgi:hypothetical protein|nr:hypothetical protein [Propionibacteriaceae bacterium]
MTAMTVMPAAGTWVSAAPFRSYVVHLMDAADVPWRVVAQRAGVPAAVIHTLLFGRRGRPRPTIPSQFAGSLLALSAAELRGLRLQRVAAPPTQRRVQALLEAGLPLSQVARWLGLDRPSCRQLASGQAATCSALVEALARAACEAHRVGSPATEQWAA